MGSLLDAVNAVEKTTAPDVEGIVDRALYKLEMSHKTNFYPSGFTSKYWCRRKKMLNRIYTEMYGSYPSETQPDSGRIFILGNIIHKIYQDNLLSQDTNFVGKWSCQVCESARPDGEDAVVVGSNTEWVPKPDYRCPTCSFKMWQYEEVRVEDLDLGWSGKLDGIITHHGDHWIIDIKTISAIRYPDVKAPDPGYVMQLQCYMKETGIKKALLYYVEKDRLRHKAFVVHYNEGLLEEMFEGTIHDFNRHVEQDKMPRKHSWCNPGNWMEEGCIYGPGGLGTCKGPRKISTMRKKLECTDLPPSLSQMLQDEKK